MISEIKGNLLTCSAHVIIHCCNCYSVMGSGVAKALSDKWPIVSDADKGNHLHKKDRLGKISVAKINDDKSPVKYVINLYGQFGLGSGARFLNYEAFYTGLERTKEFIEDYNSKHKVFGKIKTIAFPWKIGSDRAGGNWVIVWTMIEEVFKNCDFDVFIVKLTN